MARVNEYLATMHLLVAEVDFLGHNTLSATQHYSDALDVNSRATVNAARNKREVLARERLATIAARIGKYDSALIHIANALDLARKGDPENYGDVLEVAIAIYSKLGDKKRVAKLQAQLNKIIPLERQRRAEPAQPEEERPTDQLGSVDQVGPVEWAIEPEEDRPPGDTDQDDENALPDQPRESSE